MLETLFQNERTKVVKAEMKALEERAIELHKTMLVHAQGSQSLLQVVGNAGVSVGIGLVAVNPIIGGAVTLLSAITTMIGNKELKESERYKAEQIRGLSVSLADVSKRYSALSKELTTIYLNNAVKVFFVVLIGYLIIK